MTWIGLWLLMVPLANDHDPLLPARNTSAASGCPVPHGRLQVVLCDAHVFGSGTGPITPFRVGVCSGPTVTRTARGLLVNAFGYDDDGTVIYRLRDNQFERIEGMYLHLHRTDRSTLAVYDKMEREILYLRYLSPDMAWIRGRFLCSQTGVVTIADNDVTVASGQLSLPSCIQLNAGVAPNFVPQNH
jgi:hypothetical protein